MKNAMFPLFNALRTVKRSLTSVQLYLVAKNAGIIDLTAWTHALLTMIPSARILVSPTIVCVQQSSVHRHAWDPGHSAQAAAMRMEALKNLRHALATAT